MSFLRTTIPLLLVIFAVFAQGCDKHSQDRAAINIVVDKLIEARDGGEGQKYSELIATESLEYYDRTLKLALNGKKADIVSLPFSQRYEILLIRLLGTRKELKGLDAKGYVAWSITGGLHEYMPSPEANLNLGQMIFRKDEAYCDLTIATERKRRTKYGGTRTVVEEAPSPYTLRFCLENGQWKFDQSTYSKALDLQIQKEIQQAEVKEDDALLYLLGKNTGEQVPANIWNGMPR